MHDPPSDLRVSESGDHTRTIIPTVNAMSPVVVSSVLPAFPLGISQDVAPPVPPVLPTLNDFASFEYCGASSDCSSPFNVFESMVRDAPVDVSGIRKTMGRQDIEDMPAIPSNPSPTMPSSFGSRFLKVNELLGEIRDLKRQVQMNAEWKREQELEAKRLHTETESLHRKVAHLETQAEICSGQLRDSSWFDQATLFLIFWKSI